MKTLVIHPKDPSTTFLSEIYKGMKNTTVLTGDGITQDEIKSLIPEYDRVIMMGHGTPYGLMTMGGFVGFRGYIIDETFVKLLSNNPNNIYIWCNADSFVNRFKLDGFHSGMFISEVSEGHFYGINVTQKEIDESNYGFSKVMRKYITQPSSVIHRNVKKHYGEMGKHNEVSDYNSNRLYYKESLFIR